MSRDNTFTLRQGDLDQISIIIFKVQASTCILHRALEGRHNLRASRLSAPDLALQLHPHRISTVRQNPDALCFN